MNFYCNLSEILKAVIGKFVLSISIIKEEEKTCKLDGIMDTIIEPLIISIDAESNTSFGGSDTDIELALQ